MEDRLHSSGIATESLASGSTESRASKLSARRDRMKSVKSCGSFDTARAFTSRCRRPSISRSMKFADEIDEVVQTFLAETNQNGRLQRLSYGIYMLGSRKIGVHIKNGKPLVRIGGGAMVHLDLYLTHVLMSVARPVSVETLSSIPWMSGKSLSHAMREVSLRGPNEKAIWNQLVSRADVISKSFSSKQSALLLNSIARVSGHPDLIGTFDPFLRRYVRKFLIHALEEASSLDLAQTVHALGDLSKNAKPNDQLVQMLLGKLRACVPDMDDRSLSMTSFGLCRMKLDIEPTLLEIFLKRALSLGENLSDRTLAQVLNLASIKGNESLIGDLVAQSAPRIITMNFRTLCLLVSSLGRLRLRNQTVTAALGEVVLSPSFSAAVSVEQLAIIHKSSLKLGVGETHHHIIHRLDDLMKERTTVQEV